MKTEHKNRQIAKIQRKKIKIDRKMTKGRKQQGEDNLKRDIIEDYANFASRVYAGITHEGLSLDKIANKVNQTIKKRNTSYNACLFKKYALFNYIILVIFSMKCNHWHLETSKCWRNYTRVFVHVNSRHESISRRKSRKSKRIRPDS